MNAVSNVVPMREAPISSEGRVPPHDLDAEAAVLSAVMIDPRALGCVSDFLRPEHFYAESHRRIYEAALQVKQAGRPTDLVNVGTQLKTTDRVAQIGGMAYLAQLLDAAPFVTNVLSYAETVFDTSRERQVIAACQRIAATGYLDHGPTQEFADEAARAISVIASRGLRGTSESNQTVLVRIVKRIRSFADGTGLRITGIPSGFPSIDRLTLGWHAKSLVLIVGLPGHGKTTFCINTALHVLRQGIGVQYFCSEQTQEELTEKLICLMAQVDYPRFAIGRLIAVEWNRVMAACTEFQGLPIWFDASPQLNVNEIRARARARAERAYLIDKKPLGLVIVDHLHKLAMPPDLALKKRHEQLDRSAEALKMLAAELNVPVLVPAQQKTIDDPSRGKDRSRAKPKPRLGNVFESRGVEAHASQVGYLWRPPDSSGNEAKDVIQMIWAKVRGGAEGEVELGFNGAQSRFVDVDAQTNDRVDPLIPTSRVYVDPNPGASDD